MKIALIAHNKKKDEIIELSKKYDLYRQDYCGCAFSKAERERQKQGLLQDFILEV